VPSIGLIGLLHIIGELNTDLAAKIVNLPAHFLVWAASEESTFLKNKLVFAAWDVEELKARKDEIANSSELTIGLNGFPRDV
jgi:hypothetical protein